MHIYINIHLYIHLYIYLHLFTYYHTHIYIYIFIHLQIHVPNPIDPTNLVAFPCQATCWGRTVMASASKALIKDPWMLKMDDMFETIGIDYRLYTIVYPPGNCPISTKALLSRWFSELPHLGLLVPWGAVLHFMVSLGHFYHHGFRFQLVNLRGGCNSLPMTDPWDWNI